MKWLGISEISEELKTSINVTEKTGFFLYNYNDNVLIPRNDSILIRCRGLVLDLNGRLFNYPFDRFFNSHEKECKDVSFINSEIQEKLDGSLISVWFDEIDWRVTTRGAFYPNNKADINYEQEFKRLFNQFKLLDKNNCYIFELISKKNRIVTYYKNEKVVLLGVRNLDSFREIAQKELDELAIKMKVDRPKKYKADNLEDCKKLFNELKDDEEGLVIVDKDFNRVKMKQESYLKLSRIKMLKEQDIFNYVLGREEIDKDFLGKFKEVDDKIEELRTIWKKARKKILSKFDELKHLDKDSRKIYAREALKYKFSGILFKLIDGKNIDDLELKIEYVKEW